MSQFSVTVSVVQRPRPVKVARTFSGNCNRQ